MNGALFTKVKSKIRIAIKESDTAMKMATRMVLGEVPRLNKKAGELPTDSEMVKIINGLIKSERMTVEYSGADSSEYLKNLEELLPETVSEEVIVCYLNTVDFSALKNKMQAINLVKDYFGAAAVDGNMVKTIVMEKF